MENSGKPNWTAAPDKIDEGWANYLIEQIEKIAPAFFMCTYKMHNLTNNIATPGYDMGSQDAIRTYALSIVCETMELIQELNWKPWKKTKKEIDREKVKKEFADIIAFIGVLTTILKTYGIEPEELGRAYAEVERDNVKRFTTNY